MFFFVLILNLQPVFILPLPLAPLHVPVALLDMMATHAPFTMALSYQFANFYPLLLKNFVGASDFVLGVEGKGRHHSIIKYKNAPYFIFDHKEKGMEGKVKSNFVGTCLYIPSCFPLENQICNEMKRDFLYLNIADVFGLMQHPIGNDI